MEYMTTREAVIKWNISERRIRQLLQDGRIEGAKKVGNTWNIPINVNKPADKRNIKLENRVENFTITAASEIMTTFCLATSLEDLKTRIGNILVGYTSSNEEIYVRDLHCEEAATALLKDALKPNLVQTLNHSPALVHGGPFANIAHGCNSVIATNLALSLSDYVITEAGFGSDMGALKFLDIKCGTNDFYPDLIIVNSTIRSLKYNGNNNLEQGIKNLEYHITNMKKFNDNVLVILNKFKEDKEEEIEFVKQFCNRLNTEIQVSNMYFDGTKNTKELTEKVVELANQPNTKGCNIYNKEDDIITKITKYCKELFYAKEVVFEEIAKKQIENIYKSDRFSWIDKIFLIREDAIIKVYKKK